MSKAEEFAYSKYPKDKKGVLYDLARNSIIQGYQQAEKDLELTYDDICEIMEIREDVLEMNSYENLYEEVLKRFRESKEIKKK